MKYSKCEQKIISSKIKGTTRPKSKSQSSPIWRGLDNIIKDMEEHMNMVVSGTVGTLQHEIDYFKNILWHLSVIQRHPKRPKTT